ncbi:putative E3 ubiquitin-protein ligase RF4 [Oryza brachyantha]|uniref:putative E3 ubiquitin-protein ligase RF4 n=1 Tax=Oryza brachyantha TaxID=4533 RepID=UPI001AD9B005|nr:putative E3 ubiquitin-protein ligase RF4 [Oryza brachyantha]
MVAAGYSGNPRHCHVEERDDKCSSPKLQPDFSADEILTSTSGDSSLAHLKLRHLWSSVQDFVVEHVSSKDLDLYGSKELLESNRFQYMGNNDLRDIVLYSLHAFFKTAVEMISYEGHTEDAVVEAIVDSALCYQFDGPITKIAESARTLLQGGKVVGSFSGKNLDTDLHMLGFYILSCASNLLRKYFPFFTWGDALWCILLCDMDLSIAHAFLTGMNAVASEESEGLEVNGQNLNESSGLHGCSAAEYLREYPLSRSLAMQRMWFSTLTDYIVSIKKSAGKDQVASSGQGQVDSFGQMQKASSLPRTAVQNNRKSAKGTSSKGNSIKSLPDSRKDKDFWESFQLAKSCGKTSSRKLKDSRNVSAFLESACSTLTGTTKVANTMGVKSTTLVSTLPLSSLSSVKRIDSPTVVSTPPLPFPVNHASSSSYNQSGTKHQTVPNGFVHFTLPKTPADGFDFYFSHDGMQTAWVPKDRTEELALDLIRRLGELKLEFKVWTDWASDRVMQSTSRLATEKAILASLRKEVEKAEDCGVFNRKKLEETEKAIENTSHELDRADSRVLELASDISCCRLQKEAAKLQEQRSDASCADILRKKNESLEKLKSVGKEKIHLQEELAAESSKVTKLEKNLERAKGYMDSLKKRCQEGEKMVEEAKEQVHFEKNELRRIEMSARTESNLLILNAQNEARGLQANIKHLEQLVHERLESLHQSMKEVGSSNNFWIIPEIANHPALGLESVRREQECVMCMEEEISVVFLPCRHQVVCVGCNQLHQDQGMTDCPSCRSPIKRRICARFADSS